MKPTAIGTSYRLISHTSCSFKSSAISLSLWSRAENCSGVMLEISHTLKCDKLDDAPFASNATSAVAGSQEVPLNMHISGYKISEQLVYSFINPMVKSQKVSWCFETLMHLGGVLIWNTCRRAALMIAHIYGIFFTQIESSSRQLVRK